MEQNIPLQNLTKQNAQIREELIADFVKVLDSGRYVSGPGVEKFENEFANYVGASFGIGLSTGSAAVELALKAVGVEKGDEVIVPSMTFIASIEAILEADAVPVLIDIDKSTWNIDANLIEKAITSKTKALLFSSPCNPTGSVYLESELKAIAQVIGKHPGIIIVADEIYEYINFTGKHISIGSFPEVKDQTVTVNGFSKGYAMTGWRLGYMGGPQWLSDACNKVQGQITSGANSFSQKAATFALQTKLPETEIMKTAFLKRRDMVLQLLQEIPGVKVNLPLGAFYIFPDISAYFGKKSDTMEINNANDFCDYILQEAFVAVVSGAAFGADECFRISYAASEAELKEAVARMARVLALLK